MTNTTARIKKAGKNFEIIVNLEEAMNVKKGNSESIEPEGDKIFTDSKKGFVSSPKELEEAFGTTDTSEIALRIIKEGEVLLTQEYRDEEKEKKYKNLINFLAKNGIDPQTGKPISESRIKSAVEEARINLKNVPIENQLKDIIEKLNKIIPIKLETKKIKITMPASYVGKAYGVITQYKTKETWKDDGSLEVIINIPAGLIMDFYDKLNSMTHGSALTEEIKE
ncbi:MAG: ribosome assembly factor SBDS [Minisyncoccales bacterium]